MNNTKTKLSREEWETLCDPTALTQLQIGIFTKISV